MGPLTLAGLRHGRVAYRIYASEWLGIDLARVADEAHLSVGEAANDDFYARLYRQWRARPFQPPPGWLAAKRKWAATYRDFLRTRVPADARILSVGAGLGHLERHLIDLGLQVDLQECQAESLDPRDFPTSRIWVSADLTPVPSASYDVVLAVSLVYLFDDARYGQFVRECRRVLKPAGVLVIADHDPSWPVGRIRQWLVNKARGRREMPWGWARSPNLHTFIVQSNGFRIVDRRFFRHGIEPVAEPFRIFGLQLPRGRSLGQVLVFRSLPMILLLMLLAGCGTGPSEKVDLAQECVVADSVVASARTTIDLAMAREGQALLYQTVANRYALLEMPGCRVTPLTDVPERVGVGNMFVLPGGTRLFPTSPPGRAELSWWYARGAEARPARVEFLPDPKSPSQPILSNDGAWVAWLRSAGTQDAWRVEMAMRRLDGKDDSVVRLDSLEPDTYELLDVDAAAREITVARGLNEFLRIGFDGGVRGRTKIAEVAAQPDTYVRPGDGYFAWDANRESGPYRIGWSLPSGRDTLALESLRRIHHAAIDPAGRFAAVSLESQHGRLLSLTDAVAVVRLSDRREVFRRYLPRFTRSEVTFLTADYVAYADANQVRVLRLPK
jgi:SAM-dependent methyltransferase